MSLSHYILDALRRVLPKLRSRHGLSDDGIADLVDCLAFQADLVEPAAHWDEQLTDPFDQAILGTLVAAQTTSSPATRPCSLWLVTIRRSEQPGFSRCMGLLLQTAGDISGGVEA